MLLVAKAGCLCLQSKSDLRTNSIASNTSTCSLNDDDDDDYDDEDDDDDDDLSDGTLQLLFGFNTV